MTAPPAEAWRRLGPAAREPGDAVSLPVRLLETMSPGDAPVASWSTVTRPVLVRGRSGRPDPVGEDLARARGIAVAERRSGGAPVLWDADLLSLDVVLPPGHPLAGTDVTQAYRWLGEAVAAALEGLGAVVRVAGIDEARAAARATDPASVAARRTCYGGLSPFEVVDAAGRKVVGLSQARRRTGTLFQCGILRDADVATLASLVEPDMSVRMFLAEALGDRMAGTGLDHARVVAAVDDQLHRRHGVVFTPEAPPG